MIIYFKHGGHSFIHFWKRNEMNWIGSLYCYSFFTIETLICSRYHRASFILHQFMAANELIERMIGALPFVHFHSSVHSLYCYKSISLQQTISLINKEIVDWSEMSCFHSISEINYWMKRVNSIIYWKKWVIACAMSHSLSSIYFIFILSLFLLSLYLLPLE